MRRALPSILAAAMLVACAEESAPPQPAPPADRNFTATVNDLPVVGGTYQFECVVNTLNDAGHAQFLLTFSDDVGHQIQIGIERGADRPGQRAILYGMATSDGRAYGRPKDASATLTAIDLTRTGAIVSGNFDVSFDLVNVAPGIVDKEPLRVRQALFEQVKCVDPKLLREQAQH